MTIKIAVIGFGNIAKAIITPLLEKNLISPEDIYCLVNSKESLDIDYELFQFKANSFLSLKLSIGNDQHLSQTLCSGRKTD